MFSKTKFHILSLIVLNAILFLPMMGRGFIRDDFGHVYVAANESVRFGLLGATGGPFYTPATWATFKLNWILFGARPFPWAMTNLLIHTLNAVLVYYLTLKLWQSRSASWCAAFGFALLYPSNFAAVLFIGTRAHILATLFYLAAMITAVYYSRTERITVGIAVVVFCALAMFSKENGVTVIAAVPILIFYERKLRGLPVLFSGVLAVSSAMILVLLFYLILRSGTDAVPIDFSRKTSYGYNLSLRVLLDNILAYAWRAYGILMILILAIAVSFRLRGVNLRPKAKSNYDILLSATLFLVAVAPFLLIDKQPNIYSYLPGVAASLLVASVTCSFFSPDIAVRRPTPLTLLPVILVTIFCGAYMTKLGYRLMEMAKTNAFVLKQIAEQHPKLKANTFIVLKYSEADRVHRFPEGFLPWDFRWALRVVYSDRTVDGQIIKEGVPFPIPKEKSEVHFLYTTNGKPKVVKIGETQ